MRYSVRLMLFVALLLPFRGALAVSGWLCHTDMPSSIAPAAHQPVDAPMADTHQDADMPGCHGMGDNRGQTSNGRQANTHNAACNLCSSVCGAPAFPSAVAQFSGLLPSGAERFPAIAPPRVEFAVGGLERPPRTI